VAQVGWLGPGGSRRPPGAVLYLSRELTELSQWLCNDERTINIVAVIIIISIIIIIVIIITKEVIKVTLSQL